MEYQVPQFIEVEDKIFGPLSLKQFVFVAGGVGLCVIIFLYLPVFIAVIVAIPVAGLTFALAFYKVNNKSFLDLLSAGFSFYTGGRLFLWKKNPPKSVSAVTPTPVPRREKLGLSQGKLKELAWSLDVQDRTQPPQ